VADKRNETKTYVDVVNLVVERLDRLDQLSGEIKRCRIAAAALPGYEEAYAEQAKLLTKDLESLDVTAERNFGWERRIVPFLAQFRRSLIAKPTDP
jgi:hypothetical protein